MPISCTHDGDLELFRIVYTGRVALHDVMAFIDDFESDFLRFPRYGELCDVVAVTEIDISLQEARALFGMVTSIYRTLSPKRRVAYFHGGSVAAPVVAGLCRKLVITLPTVRAASFATKAEALAYLRV